MRRNTRFLVQSAMIAALYVVLTHLQNLLPGNLTWGAVQFRVSEALGILAFFTPTAIPGLGLGCLVFNLTSGAALPFDYLVGTLASVLAAFCMWKTRSITVKGLPLLGLFMPAVFNSLLVGWELAVYIGGGFAFNAICVALGELGVLLTLGVFLFYAIKKRKLDEKLFR